MDQGRNASACQCREGTSEDSTVRPIVLRTVKCNTAPLYRCNVIFHDLKNSNQSVCNGEKSSSVCPLRVPTSTHMHPSDVPADCHIPYSHGTGVVRRHSARLDVITDGTQLLTGRTTPGLYIMVTGMLYLPGHERFLLLSIHLLFLLTG